MKTPIHHGPTAGMWLSRLLAQIHTTLADAEGMMMKDPLRFADNLIDYHNASQCNLDAVSTIAYYDKVSNSTAVLPPPLPSCQRQ